MGKKGLVLFVEGDGDEEAVPHLVKRLLTDKQMWDAVHLDPHVMRTGGIEALTGSKAGNWLRYLQAAMKRRNAAGVLVVLDGDAKKVRLGDDRPPVPFCASQAARHLVEQSRSAGAGKIFSVAVVFACQEYESWLIAGIASLRGRPLQDGRPGVSANAPDAPKDIEVRPRDAKDWLSRHMPNGYKPTQDQAPLTQLLDLEALRGCGLRSFRRLEHALDQLCAAFQSQAHVATPK